MERFWVVRENLSEGERAMVSHVDVRAVWRAGDEVGVGAAEPYFICCPVGRVLDAKFEVIVCVS